MGFFRESKEAHEFVVRRFRKEMIQHSVSSWVLILHGFSTKRRKTIYCMVV